MRILVIVSYYKPAYVYGGPVKSISSLCEALADLDQEVTVLTTNANGTQRLDVPLEKSIDVNGVEVIYYPIAPGFPSSFFYSPALVRGIHQRAKEYDIAVLELLFTHAMGPAVSVCRKNHIPYVVPPRGQLMPWALSHKRLKKALYLGLLGRNYLNHAAALHCTDANEVVSIKKLKLRCPYFVLANGMDLSKLSNNQERGRIRRQYEIPMDSFVILFLGRLHPKKRPDIAIQAFATLKSEYPNAYLLMCGPDEGGMIDDLKSKALASGCSDRVMFTGLIGGDKVQQVLADTDLLIMPSEPQSENFGMSAVEALAAGVPILTSQGVPIGLWAERFGAGKVVPTEPARFGEMAIQMLSDIPALKDMGQRGRNLVHQHFDIRTLAQDLLCQYEAICKTGKPLPEKHA